ncbi:MAG: hypothetical protein KJO07_03260 [Deltaproteobacteria bacterium]|nr:hypothetical protein [Deltaproteobacteria bacterium]
MRAQWLVIALALLVGHGSALAQPRAASPAAHGRWQNDYDRARGLMLDGKFAEAAPLFDGLIARTNDPIERAIARQNAQLCRQWAERGARLHFGKGDLAVAAGDKDRRTSGELASLYISAVVYGLGSGGVVGVYTEPDSAGAGILPSLALAGVSVGGVYILDRQTKLGYGVPQSISTGLSIGLLEGLSWTFWHFSSVNSEDEWSGETIATLIWGAATAGGIIGGVLGHQLGTSPGRAAFLESAARWTGLTAGLALSAIPGDDDQKDDAGFLAGALGLTVGAVGGYFIARTESPSVARARFIDLGGISGGLVAGGLYLSVANDDTDYTPFALTTAAGITTGLALSYYLTRNMDPDAPGAPAASSSLSPTVMPTADGEGMTIGFGGSLR